MPSAVSAPPFKSLALKPQRRHGTPRPRARRPLSALMRGRSSSSGAASAPRAGCCCRRWREAALCRCLHRRRPQWREAALCRCLYRRRRRWRAAALRQVSGTECRGCRCCGVGRRKTPVRLNMLFRSAMSSRARQWLFHCPIPVLDCLTPQHGRHRRGFRWWCRPLLLPQLQPPLR